MTTQVKKTKERDALTLLVADHDKVQELFAAFEKAMGQGDLGAKAELADQLCLELAVHAAVEDQVFYPAVAKAIHEGDLLGEAVVEHGEAKHLMSRLASMEAEDPLYDPTVRVLFEYVMHHVREEQDKLFPKVKRSDLDLEALGKEIQERKKALLDEAEANGYADLLSAAEGGYLKRNPKA